MKFSLFARIGKHILSKAIGLQDNYEEVIEQAPDKLDELQSGCESCSIYKTKMLLHAVGCEKEYEMLHHKCKGCGQAVWEKCYQYRYKCRTTEYGYQPALKSNALKLLLLYHFLQPDALGMIKHVDIKELAEILGCVPATIQASNEALVNFGYCLICHTGNGLSSFHVWLKGYPDYNKPLEDGGKESVILSRQMLDEFFSLKGVNQLRLNIKGILEVIEQRHLTLKNNFATTSYKSLQNSMPSYCKRNVIIKALNTESSMLQFDVKPDSITFELNENYTQKRLNRKMEDYCYKQLVAYIEELNELFNISKRDHQKPTAEHLLSALWVASAPSYPPLVLKSELYAMLSTLCVEYSIPLVKQAISLMYNFFTLRGIELSTKIYYEVIVSTIKDILHTKAS